MPPVDNTTQTAAAAENSMSTASEAEKANRERSRIAFVYADLESAVDLCRAIQRNAGASCDVDQLAAWMNQTPRGGTFRARSGAARLFGLIETGQGSVTLATLGRDILDESRSAAARSEAFLRVPLFRAMYDQYKGYALPPQKAIENQMEQLGVPPKQVDRARQTFASSAEYAGYLDSQNGRFVKPATAAPPPPSPETPAQKADPPPPAAPPPGTIDLPLDPLLVALLRLIPQKATKWPKEQRVRWFRTFAMNVSQVYDTPEDAVDLKIELEQ